MSGVTKSSISYKKILNSFEYMAKFILNRPDDWQVMPLKKRIITTVKWYFILMAAAIVLRIVCFACYMANGLNPTELTTFGGDPTNHTGGPFWKTFIFLMVVAPVVEEVMFRLGLSFKRRTVALWAGLTPLACAAYLFHNRDWLVLLLLAAVGALLFLLVMRNTTDEQWQTWRRRYIIPAMWASAIGFGLVHFMAFTVLNWQVMPFALATILVPMAGGCAVTYARVNLGFWWGVLVHCCINIPGVVMIASTL